jgi:DNA polymerase-3 subunit delta
VFGTDPGMVSERAGAVAKALAARDTPPSEILRIDDTDLDTDPDRLAIELSTVSMFADGKVIRTTASRKVTAAFLEPLLDPARMTASLVVEAANLKPDDKLRKFFEKAAFAAAIPCYADNVRDLSSVVDEVLSATGIAIEPDAREALLARLGADRALSRNEIEKLALYAHGRNAITADDVAEIVGDASELTVDRIVMASAAGDSRAASVEFHRAMASGESAQYVILATLNHIQRLHRIRSELEAGKSFDEATRRIRPPLHFKQKAAIQGQCNAWSLAALNRAIAMANATAREARLSTQLEEVLAERLLAEVSTIAARSRRR